MPRFYFHVFNGDGKTPDNEGLDAPDQAAARKIALDSVRSMIAEEARGGAIDLTGRITIEDDAANLLLTVYFTEAFRLVLPERRTLR